jgi:hypothetical protein
MRLLLIVAPGELHPPGTLSRPDLFLAPSGVPAAPLAMQPRKMVRSCDIQPDDLPVESEEDSFESAPPRRFDSWRRRSALGAIATGVALGLRDIFQPGKCPPWTCPTPDPSWPGSPRLAGLPAPTRSRALAGRAGRPRLLGRHQVQRLRHRQPGLRAIQLGRQGDDALRDRRGRGRPAEPDDAQHGPALHTRYRRLVNKGFTPAWCATSRRASTGPPTPSSTR